MAEASAGPHDSAQALVTAALAPALRRILDDIGAPQPSAAIEGWLETEWTWPGAQETGALQAGIEMAVSRCAPGIGCVVGQVWRKWQDQVRRGDKPASTPPETAARLPRGAEALRLRAAHRFGPRTRLPRRGGDHRFGSRRRPPDRPDRGRLDPACLGPSRNRRGHDRRRPPRPRPLYDRRAARRCPARPRPRSPDRRGLRRDEAVACDGRRPRGGVAEPGISLPCLLALGSAIAVASLHDCFGQAARRGVAGVADRLPDWSGNRVSPRRQAGACPIIAAPGLLVAVAIRGADPDDDLTERDCRSVGSQPSAPRGAAGARLEGVTGSAVRREHEPCTKPWKRSRRAAAMTPRRG